MGVAKLRMPRSCALLASAGVPVAWYGVAAHYPSLSDGFSSKHLIDVWFATNKRTFTRWYWNTLKKERGAHVDPLLGARGWRKCRRTRTYKNRLLSALVVLRLLTPWHVCTYATFSCARRDAMPEILILTLPSENKSDRQVKKRR